MKHGIREIGFEEMQRRVLRAIRPVATESSRIERARGRILAQAIRVTGPQPAFDKSAMDGFALRSVDTPSASPAHHVTLDIIATVAAGRATNKSIHKGQTARIMTGAPIPRGADAVIPIEHVRVSGNTLSIMESVHAGAHLNKRGSDMHKGELVLPRGALIGPSQMAMLALLDLPKVEVYKLPRVGVLTTGDELGPVGRKRAAGHIPDSNRYGLIGQIESTGCVPVDGGRSGDDTRDLKRAILSLSRRCDFIVTSGGVSAGDFDVVKILFCEIGGVHLYRIPMKPGKPQAFGQVEGVPYFGLPGNPVSAMVVFDFMVRPALLKLAGHKPSAPLGWSAIAKASFSKKSRQWEFPRVIASRNGDEWEVTPVRSQRSSDLKSMTDATGYAVLTPADSPPKAGQSVRYVPFVS